MDPAECHERVTIANLSGSSPCDLKSTVQHRWQIGCVPVLTTLSQSYGVDSRPDFALVSRKRFRKCSTTSNYSYAYGKITLTGRTSSTSIGIYPITPKNQALQRLESRSAWVEQQRAGRKRRAYIERNRKLISSRWFIHVQALSPFIKSQFHSQTFLNQLRLHSTNIYHPNS